MTSIGTSFLKPVQTALSPVVKAGKEIISGGAKFWFTEHAADFLESLPASLKPERVQAIYPDARNPKVLEKLSVSKEMQAKIDQTFLWATDYKMEQAIRRKIYPAGYNFLKNEYLNVVFKHEKFPGSIFKCQFSDGWTSKGEEEITIRQIDRVPMSVGLRKVIAEKELVTLYVPEKRYAHVPGRPLEMEGRNYMAVAEELPLCSSEETFEMMRKMSVVEPEKAKTILRHLFTLMLSSGYADGHRWNFAFIASGENKGKLAIYDTESFGIIQRREILPRLPREMGFLREDELKRGAMAIHQAIGDIDPEACLCFSKEIMQEVAAEFLPKVRKDLNRSGMHGVLLALFPTLLVITSIATQVVLDRYKA